MGGERCGDDLCRRAADLEQGGSGQGGAHETDRRGVLGGPGAVEREEYDGAPLRLVPDQLEVLVGERGCDGHCQRSGVLLADLGGREVQSPEGPVGGRGEGREPLGRPQGEWEALGVHQLDLGALSQLGREGERDPRIRDVAEVCQRGEGA